MEFGGIKEIKVVFIRGGKGTGEGREARGLRRVRSKEGRDECGRRKQRN